MNGLYVPYLLLGKRYTSSSYPFGLFIPFAHILRSTQPFSFHALTLLILLLTHCSALS